MRFRALPGGLWLSVSVSVAACLVASAVLAGAGCSSFGDDTRAAVDGSVADVPSDAPLDALLDAPTATGPRRCAAGSRFDGVQIVPFDPTLSVESARFSPAGDHALLAVWQLENSGRDATDVVTADVSGPAITLLGPAPFNALGSFDAFPSAIGGSTDIVFTSNRTFEALRVLRLYQAGAASTDAGAPLPNPIALAPRSAATDPYVLASGAALYFAAKPEGGTQHVYRATRAGSTFATANATLLSTLVTPDKYEQAPVVSEDEQEIFFASDRSVDDAFEIWTALHQPGQAAHEFLAPGLVPGLASTGLDFPTWLSPDACSLYFISKAKDARSAGTLKVATRRP